MKSIFAALMVAFLVIGCDHSNPNSSSSGNTGQSQVMFSELSMAKTANAMLSTDISTVGDDGVQYLHDSMRNAQMLDSLKVYLSLTEVQFTSLKEYGTTLLATLGGIRSQVIVQSVTKDSARLLVIAARDQFVASVNSMLTTQQSALFQTWLIRYWNNKPFCGIPRPIRNGIGPDRFIDSLRHAQILDSLKAYLALTDDQFLLLKDYDTILFSTLNSIQSNINTHSITPDSAMTLQKAARDQFISSLKSILTADQIILLDTWEALHEKTPPHRDGTTGPRRGPHGGPVGGRP